MTATSSRSWRLSGRVRDGQAEVVGALAIALLTALAVYVAAHTIQLQESQLSEVREYASLLMKIQAEDIAFRTNKTAGTVDATPNMNTVAVYRAVINVTGGEVLWRSADAVSLNPGEPATLYSGELVDDVVSCRASLIAVTKNGKLYTFCGLYKSFGSGPVEGASSGDSNSLEVLATWVYERVPPTYVTLDKVVYRVRRVIAPDTYLYLYAYPNDKAAIAVGEDSDLVGRVWWADPSKVVVNTQYVTSANLPPMFDWDDSTLGYLSTGNGHPANTPLMWVDLGSVREGFLYFGSTSSVYTACVSNDTTTWSLLPYASGSTTRYLWRVKARYAGVCSRLGGAYVGPQVSSFEFYPVEVWGNRLSFPATLYGTPVMRTVTLFAQAGTSVQLVEATRLPK